MDLTLEEKQIITYALHHTFNGLTEKISDAVTCVAYGSKIEGESKEFMANTVKTVENYLTIQKKIFATYENEERGRELLSECEGNLEHLQHCKISLGLVSHDGESETPERG